MCLQRQHGYLFIFIFLALRRRCGLTIKISHTCSAAAGRKRSTFVFSRKKKVTELRLKRWNMLLSGVKVPPRIPVRQNVLKSGGSLENHSYAALASAWLQIPPTHASTLLQMTAHQCSQTRKLDFFFFFFYITKNVSKILDIWRGRNCKKKNKYIWQLTLKQSSPGHIHSLEKGCFNSRCLWLGHPPEGPGCTAVFYTHTLREREREKMRLLNSKQVLFLGELWFLSDSPGGEMMAFVCVRGPTKA